MEDIFFGYDLKEWSEILRNAVLVFAAVFTAWVAREGLSSWKKQKLWEDNKELSRVCLGSLLEMHLHLSNAPKNKKETELWTLKAKELIAKFEADMFHAVSTWEDGLSAFRPYHGNIQNFLTELIETNCITEIDDRFSQVSSENLTNLQIYLRQHLGRKL